MELLRFIPMNEMFERAGASEVAIFQRTKAVMEYYKMPFDVPPPE